METNFPYIYLPNYYVAERELAALLVRQANEPAEPVLGWEAYSEGLDQIQYKALSAAMSSNLHMIFGLPGSGKTTLVRRIVQAFDNASMTGMILAPAGQAVKRAKEVIWEVHEKLGCVPECKTTYRGLEYMPSRGMYLRNPRNPLDLDYVIIDEWGFVGSTHARDVLLGINPKRTRIILVGDPYQLPSVEPGSVYRDMINSSRFSYSELTEIHRTGANSGIAFNAALILRGEMPVKVDPRTQEAFRDWKFIISNSEENTKQLIVKYITEDIPKYYGVDATKDIQLISPGKKSEIGVAKLNEVLRETLNPGKPRYKGFRLNDKVINKNTSRQLFICNGDRGRIIDIGDHGMTIDFGPGSGIDDKGIVKIDSDHSDNIHLNYAQTVHSTQGCEIPIAVIPLHRCHWNLLSRNLLFTAQTRAKKAAIIIGDPDALNECIRHSETLSRTTGLTHWLNLQAA